jgi:hypothetical protein
MIGCSAVEPAWAPWRCKAESGAFRRAGMAVDKVRPTDCAAGSCSYSCSCAGWKVPTPVRMRSRKRAEARAPGPERGVHAASPSAGDQGLEGPRDSWEARTMLLSRKEAMNRRGGASSTPHPLPQAEEGRTMRRGIDLDAPPSSDSPRHGCRAGARSGRSA